jgi:nucleotide-binding universal stress UspA family protein
MAEAAPILVPTDFSADSEHALEHATRAAQGLAAPIVLLHVEEGAGAEPDSPATLARRKDARDALARTQRDLAARDVASEVVIRPGDPAREILDVAVSWRVAMIVIATHGWTAVSALLLGSVADRVIRHATQPVLVVRHPTRTPGAAPRA